MQEQQEQPEEAVIDQKMHTNDVITLVLTADNHLGYMAAGQRPQKREALRQRLRRAFQQATDFAIGQGVDLFVQAGDLFDTAQPPEQDRSFVAARLAELKQAGIRTFALGGAHDTPASSRLRLGDAPPAPQISFASLGALHYFPPVPADEHEQGDASASVSGQTLLQPVLLKIRDSQVGICGLGAVAGQQGDPLERLRVDSEIERAAIPLLLLSAPIEGVPVGTLALGAQAQVSRDSIAEQTIFRTILAGFSHEYQRFKVGQADVIIAGSTQHFDVYDQSGRPGFVFLGIAADGVRWCRHIEVDTLPLYQLVIALDELWRGETDTSPAEQVLERLRPFCKEEAIVRLRLEGEVSRRRYHELDLGAIRRYAEAHTFAFTVDDSALSFLQDDDGETGETGSTPTFHPAVFEERLSPREELIGLADEWIAAAQDKQEQQALLATKEELLAALWNA